MNKPITTRRIYSEDGSFSHLELCQDGNIIKLSLGSTSLETNKDYSKWGNLKEIVEAHSKQVTKELNDELRASTELFRTEDK